MASHDDSPFVMQGTGFAFIASRSRRLLGELKALQSEALNDGFVDEGAALAILDLDDPDVGIKAHLLVEIISASLLVGGIAQRPHPNALFTAAGGAEHRQGAIQAIELEKNRARLLGSATHQIGGRACRFAAADQGLDKNPAFKSEDH